MEHTDILIGLKCSLCLEKFCDERPPYVLTCGHNLCLFDLEQIEQGNCPLCRRVNENYGEYKSKNF